MHIAIDNSPLETGHSGRGTGMYTRLLIQALERYKPKNTYTLFTRVQDIPKNVDIVHFPYFDPFFLTLPWGMPKNTVVTVHDLIPLVYPAHFSPGIRGTIKWQIQRFKLRQSAHIITDSHASGRDIHRIAGVEQARITVVSLAPDEKFATHSSRVEKEDIKKRFDLPDQFFLYVGDINWNKNVLGLLTALSLLPHAHLVLVGKAFMNLTTKEAREIVRYIESLGISNRVHMVGYVDDGALPALYGAAAATVIPSFAEGFGFPVLESMASGTPTVVATGSSLDEVAGPSIRIDPQHPEDIARGLTAVGKLDRSTWRKLAEAWVTQYSWQKVADETYRVYEKVVS